MRKQNTKHWDELQTTKVSCFKLRRRPLWLETQHWIVEDVSCLSQSYSQLLCWFVVPRSLGEWMYNHMRLGFLLPAFDLKEI